MAPGELGGSFLSSGIELPTRPGDAVATGIYLVFSISPSEDAVRGNGIYPYRRADRRHARGG